MILLQNIILIIGMSKIAYDDFKLMINVQQNEKEYVISMTIPFKKVAFQDLIDVIDEYRELN